MTSVNSAGVPYSRSDGLAWGLVGEGVWAALLDVLSLGCSWNVHYERVPYEGVGRAPDVDILL